MLPVEVKKDFPSFSLVGVVHALAATIHPPPGVGDYGPGIPCYGHPEIIYIIRLSDCHMTSYNNNRACALSN